MMPLTHKQRELLDYLRACEDCPSFDEMRVALDLKSKTGVHRIIGALEERGYITRLHNRARAISIVPAFAHGPLVVWIPLRGRIS